MGMERVQVIIHKHYDVEETYGSHTAMEIRKSLSSYSTTRALEHDQRARGPPRKIHLTRAVEIRFEDLYQHASNHIELVFSYRPRGVSCQS